MTPLFVIENLVKTREQKQGYRLLIRSLVINKGDRIALTGPSGCGKSTTLDILGLSLSPDSSQKFEFSPLPFSCSVQKLWDEGKKDELAKLRLDYMGYVLQTGELLPFLTVGENMTLTARLSDQDEGLAGECAREFAGDLGIEKLWDRMPGTLSVGERQRVAIVRALTSHPQIILADEPTAALDPIHAKKVMDAFLATIEKFDGTLVLVTHNLQWLEDGGLINVPISIAEKDGMVTATIDYKGAA